MLGIVEIDADNRVAARSPVPILNDIDAAFEELDARYLAGEAAVNAAHLVGQLQGFTPGSTGTNFPQRPRIGSTSTTGRS